MGLAAGAGPVVTGIGEAIERSGETIIELGEGFNFPDAGEIKFAGEDLVFVNDLFLKAIHEAGHVNSVVPIAQPKRAGGEVAGDREGHGGLHFRVDLRSLFAEVFQDDVSAKAEADKRDRLVTF